jgi:hypothetical protein
MPARMRTTSLSKRAQRKTEAECLSTTKCRSASRETHIPLGGKHVPTTLLQRQKQREAARMDAAASSTRKRLASHRTIATPEQLAPASRHMETILAAQTVDPDTGEVRTIEKQQRVVALVDKMHKEQLIGMVLHQAAERFRMLYFESLGGSAGVGSYGEYTAASEPSGRIPVTERQLKASREFDQAEKAAFAVPQKDGGWAVDEQLRDLVRPALLSDRKEVTRSNIGQQRTRYADKSTVGPAGGTIVQEVLERLSLHFGLRER